MRFSTPTFLPPTVIVLAATLACTGGAPSSVDSDAAARLARFTTIPLTADLSRLQDSELRMLPILVAAAKVMDGVFWLEAWGDPGSLLSSITDPDLRRLVEINHGPWDRLDGDAPLLPSIGPKPPGARFYPADLSASEFADYVTAHPEQGPALESLYTIVTRGTGGSLNATPYHVAFEAAHQQAAAKLKEAAALAEDAGLRRYLELRAEALLTDEYQASDLAWMDMKDNGLDIVIGPIETYEDKLLGYKASHEAYVLIKDRDWSQRLSRYIGYLPELQRGIPVPDRYRQETPGVGSDLNAYDAVYYGGSANSGAKTIAINLPNDEEVQLQKGTRRLQLKNTMRAKFDSILMPLASELIAEDQRQYIDFDAFFTNVMLHEVAHGLGIKNTVNGSGTVRAALREHYSALEEGKADILGLHMSNALRERGELADVPQENAYVTFLASIFRSVRFGASDAHGKANMIQFSFFQEKGAFTRDPDTGTYRVAFDRMTEAVAELANVFLTLEGDGDHEGAGRLLTERGVIPASLAPDLQRLADKGVPVDILLRQGMDVLQP